MNWKIWPLTMASTVMLSTSLVLCRALGPAKPRLQSFPLAAAADAPLTPRHPPPSATDAVAALTVLPPVRADGYTAGNSFAGLDAGNVNVTYFMSSNFYRDVTIDDVLRNDRDKQNHFRELSEMEAEVMNSNTMSKVSVTSEGKIYHPRKSAVNVNTAPPLSGTDETANLHIHDTSTDTESYNTQDVNEDTTVINKGSKACKITERRRGQGHLANHQLGQPQSTARVAPLMLAQASGSRYQYLPLKGDGTVHQLDPCPAPSPHTGGGNNVFAFLTFGVVTANVLMNAVANVNSNNRNNNNNENNNNNNINNENISNNLDSNKNDNTISTGRSIHGRTTSCVCHGRRDRRRETVEETTTEPSEETSEMFMRKGKNFTSDLEQQERPDGPKKKIRTAASEKTLQMAAGTGKLAASVRRKMACVARLVCEAHRSVRLTEGLASLGLRISRFALGMLEINHASRQVFEEARVRGASRGACGPAYPCLVPHLYY